MIDFLFFPLFLAFVSFLLVLLVAKLGLLGKSSLLLIVICLFLTLGYVIASFFTGAGITEAVFDHIPLIFSWVFIRPYLGIAAFGFFVAILIPLVLFYSVYIFKRRESRLNITPLFREGIACIALFFSFLSVCLHPAASEIASIAHDKYLLRGDNILAEYIAVVDIGSIKKEQRKSFIYLYAESLDRGFFDEKRFPGLMHEFSALINDRAIQVEGVFQAPMTGWTMAGMVSSQCGLPLARYATRNGVADREKIICIGDVLAEDGYSLSYFGGADVTFAGKGDFYLNHGFQEVYGAPELEGLAGKKLPRSSWGIFDDDLFNLVDLKLNDLIQHDQPFGFVFLTLDTHGPQGHKTPACDGMVYGDGNSQTLNSAYCANWLIATFVKKIITDPRFDDVLLVVASDHLMMANDAGLAARDASVEDGRANLFTIFNSGIPAQTIRREASTLDIAPTLLSFLGFDVAAMGFGRNLLQSNETLTEKYGKDEFHRLIYVWRHHLMKRWSNSVEASE